jgi:hypothetical protein
VSVVKAKVERSGQWCVAECVRRRVVRGLRAGLAKRESVERGARARGVRHAPAASFDMGVLRGAPGTGGGRYGLRTCCIRHISNPSTPPGLNEKD